MHKKRRKKDEHIWKSSRSGTLPTRMRARPQGEEKSDAFAKSCRVLSVRNPSREHKKKNLITSRKNKIKTMRSLICLKIIQPNAIKLLLLLCRKVETIPNIVRQNKSELTTRRKHALPFYLMQMIMGSFPISRAQMGGMVQVGISNQVGCCDQPRTTRGNTATNTATPC